MNILIIPFLNFINLRNRSRRDIPNERGIDTIERNAGDNVITEERKILRENEQEQQPEQEKYEKKAIKNNYK